MNKKLILSNHDSHVKAFRDIDNKKKYVHKEDRGAASFLDAFAGEEKRYKIMTNDQTARIEANTEDELKKIMKAMTETGRKGFLYIVSEAIKRGYTTDFFEVDLNELLDVLGLDRHTSNINRLHNYLLYLKNIDFYSEIKIHKKKRKTPNIEQLYSSIITDVKRVVHGRKTIAIDIKLGAWMEDLKLVRKENRAMLLTLPIECLKVDTKHYPYSFGVPYYMATYARTNAKKKTEWHTLTLQEAIKGTEPWEEAEKAIKKRGFNNERAFIERLTQSLEHAEPYFKLQWQWKDKEPETIQEARNARIEFRFLEPLKKSVEQQEKEPAK